MSWTRRLILPGRCLLAGLCIAASVPPWGWWPLAFVGIALLDRYRRPAVEAPLPAHLAGRAAGSSPPCSGCGTSRRPATLVACVLYAAYFGVAAALSPPGRARWLVLPGAVPAGRAGPLDVPVRRRPARHLGHEPGRRPARSDGSAAGLVPRGGAGRGRRRRPVRRVGARLEGGRRHPRRAGRALRPGPRRPERPRRRPAPHRHRPGRRPAAHPGRDTDSARGLPAPPRRQRAHHPAGRPRRSGPRTSSPSRARLRQQGEHGAVQTWPSDARQPRSSSGSPRASATRLPQRRRSSSTPTARWAPATTRCASCLSASTCRSAG